jgi:NAD+ kinase
MDRIALTANPERLPGPGYLEALAAALAARGFETRTEEFPTDGTASGPRELAAWADLVMVVGGDGSMLRVIHRMLPVLRPVMGVNSGRLGFLTYSAAGDPAVLATALCEGLFQISERTLIEGVVIRRGEAVDKVAAVNEIAVTRRNVARMIHVEASVRGELLNHYHADGLIVATPTGSTAYSMSAGGPIIQPEAGVMVITPVCPHALSNRSLVIPDTEAIELRAHPAEGDDPAMFTADGQTVCLMEDGDVLRIQRAEARLPLVLPPERSFFDTLRHKLRWHGSNV